MNNMLAITLSAAVPIWQMQLKLKPWDEISANIAGVPELLGEKGDILLFGGGKKGEQAEIFNRVAEGIAALSFLPGGVTVFGEHWEAKHPDLENDPK